MQKSFLNIYIFWPVFSSEDRFVLKMKHRFSQCVTSALFLGNMLRPRKYRFALCFRVLSNQYGGRNAYANIIKFNRENKRFRPPCWSPSDVLQHGVSMLSTLILPLPNNSSLEYRTFPKLWHAVYLVLLRYSDSWLNVLNDKRFYISLAW